MVAFRIAKALVDEDGVYEEPDEDEGSSQYDTLEERDADRPDPEPPDA